MGTELGRNPAMLIWREGELIKNQWLLDQPLVTIGRGGQCDVCLDLRWISRIHARVHLEGEHYVLEDAGSKNGVFVNGQRLMRPHTLQDGDRIQLAVGLELVFVDSEATVPLQLTADLTLHPVARRVLVRGQQLVPPLSPAQYDLLATLARQPGRVYSRAQVIAAVWPDETPSGITDDAIDALVRRLRQRLAELDPQHDYVITMRGYGFRLDDERRVEYI
jgi:DNA-binding winged helix-turn-helix (wHTH) protein